MKFKFIFEQVLEFNPIEVELSQEDYEYYTKLAHSSSMTLLEFLQQHGEGIDDIYYKMKEQDGTDTYFRIILVEEAE